jgi:hypothetical protein
MASKAMQRAYNKFNRLSELNKMIDKDCTSELDKSMRLQSRVTKRDMPDNWSRRTMRPGDTFKAKNAKPSACTVRKGGVV